MGKKGKWFSSVKRAFSPRSKEKKDQKLNNGPAQGNAAAPPHPPPPPPTVEVKLVEVPLERNKQEHDVQAGTSTSTVPMHTMHEQTMEAIHVPKVNKFAGKSKEEAAAIRIQTAFRGYMARRALRALRGLVRLKSLMDGPMVKRQAVHTLRCMQTLARVQSQIHSIRVRMSEEKQALQRQLLQKHAKELESLQIGDEWDDSLHSKEQVEAKLLNKYEAAMRRERALAYAFSHQQTLKNSSRSTNPVFMTSGNPTWGWSWLERWMAANPLTTEKELNNDRSSIKNATNNKSIGGEISKSFARFQLNSDKLSVSSPQEKEKPDHTSVPHSPSTPYKPISSRKLKSASPRSSFGGAANDDSRSMASMQSNRRHSFAGSSVRDDKESLASSQAVPSYMVPTKSAKAKSKLASTLAPEKNGTPLTAAKKRLSYPPSPAKPRRNSGPSNVESNTTLENGVTNGEEV